MPWIVDQYELELARQGNLMVTNSQKKWSHVGCEKGGSLVLCRDVLDDGKKATMGPAEFRCDRCGAATLPRPEPIGMGVQPHLVRGFGADPGGKDHTATFNFTANAQGKAGEDGRWS